MFQDQPFAFFGGALLALIALDRAGWLLHCGLGASCRHRPESWRGSAGCRFRESSRAADPRWPPARSSGMRWPLETNETGNPMRTLWLRMGPKVWVSSRRVKSSLSGLKMAYCSAVRFRSLVRMDAGRTRCVSRSGDCSEGLRQIFDPSRCGRGPEYRSGSDQLWLVLVQSLCERRTRFPAPGTGPRGWLRRTAIPRRPRCDRCPGLGTARAFAR